MSKYITPTLVAGIVCLILAGCASSSSVDRDMLGGGYVEVTYTRSFFSAPQAHQTSLQFRKPDTRWLRGATVMIWPLVHGCIVEKDVAIFVGEKARNQQETGESWRMKDRVFAVRVPEPPLDITDEVLWRWSSESGGDFLKLSKHATLAYLSKTNNTVGFHFGVMNPPDNHDLNIYLDWNQIADIMREVKANGVERKDLRWDTTYIEKAYK